MQTSYAYTYHYSYRPRVQIVHGTYGWTMTVDGVGESIAVELATGVVRSCIDDEFTGWTGDSVFDLCNGQVWMQTSYEYKYHYSYRPKVLIYQTSTGGYRINVDGVDGSIAVTRIY